MTHPPGSHTRANAKIAAGKIGCDLGTYLAQRAAGLRWCSGCRSWRADVHRASCLPCRRRWGSGRRHQWTDATSPWMRDTVEVDVVQRGAWGRRG
jgi:hypothetical protein